MNKPQFDNIINMPLSELIEKHLTDLSTLHCFINADNLKNIKFFPVKNNTRICDWLKMNDFSEIHFCKHIIRYFELDSVDEYELFTIAKTNTFAILYNFLEFKKEHSNFICDLKKLNSQNDWKTFKKILKSEGLQIDKLKKSDKISLLLPSHLKEIVFAMSKLSPGSIQEIKELKNKSLICINWLILASVLQIAISYFYDFQTFYRLGGLLLLLSLIIKFSLRIKYPVNIQINEFVTFNDFLSFIQTKSN